MVTLAADFARLGLELTDIQLSGTQFNAATQPRIGRIADATTDRQATAATGLGYAELEKLRALRDAARAEGG